MTADDVMHEGARDVEDGRTLDRLMDGIHRLSFYVEDGQGSLFIHGPHGKFDGLQHADESTGDFLLRGIRSVSTASDLEATPPHDAWDGIK